MMRVQQPHERFGNLSECGPDRTGRIANFADSVSGRIEDVPGRVRDDARHDVTGRITHHAGNAVVRPPGSVFENFSAGYGREPYAGVNRATRRI